VAVVGVRAGGGRSGGDCLRRSPGLPLGGAPEGEGHGERRRSHPPALVHAPPPVEGPPLVAVGIGPSAGAPTYAQRAALKRQARTGSVLRRTRTAVKSLREAIASADKGTASERLHLAEREL